MHKILKAIFQLLWFSQYKS